MTTPEFRVRPVIRHTITRYHPPSPNTSSCVETLGEFDSEGYAEIVREALAERVAPREYVIVESTMGEVMARVHYAYSEDEVQARLAEQAEDGVTYRVYSRIATPPA
jgi:hypothetical protein